MEGLAEYLHELEKYCIDNKVKPFVTICIDGQEKIYMFGTKQAGDNISYIRKLFGEAYKECVRLETENAHAIKIAQPIDMNKLKPL